ncbi:hypothetical protein ACHAWF_010662 [Thalassiosira exigua]
MDLLSGYQSSDDEGGVGGGDAAKPDGGGGPGAPPTPELIGGVPPPPPPPPGAAPAAFRRPPPGALDAAPTPSVPLAVLRSRGAIPLTSGAGGGGSRSLVLAANASVSSMGAVQGPAALCDPSDRIESFLRSIDPKTGSTSAIQADAALDPHSFAKNRNAFQRGSEGHEAALAPGGDGAKEIRRNDYGHDRRLPPNYGTVQAEGEGGDGEGEGEGEGEQAGQERSLVDPATGNIVDENRPKSRRARRKRDRDREGSLVRGPDDELSHGIWAPPSATEHALASEAVPAIESGVELDPRIKRERAYLAERDRQRGLAEGEGREKEKFDRMVERKMAHLLPPRLDEDAAAIEPSTTFHGDEEEDYRGRSWTDPPPGARGADLYDTEDHACFVPKKCVHRFTGHEKGVHRIRLSPRTGHLLLSAGLDGTCKVWSVDKRRCMRTYEGHSAAVRDVQFNLDGSKFVSASFDRFLRLWDVESGKVLGTYTNRRVPYVVKFYPHDDNTFVVGCSDNKIVAYDASSGEVTQEYDHHLAPVNAIAFVEDDGTKMVTSSDDKKVLVWEWDIGVPIKYISAPTMHSMPVIVMHPSERFLLCQSLDNRIAVYQAGERYAMQRKKKFDGHNVAGYACDVTCSPDGRFVCSGDGNGKLFFWEFKRTRILQRYHAHDKGPTIGAVWHPTEPSTVFTSGWDGVIKMWQ